MVTVLPRLVVCCLATVVCGDGFQVGVKWIESVRSELVREGKWPAYQRLKSAAQPSSRAPSIQPLIDFEDGEYIMNITIGTPPQNFLVLLNINGEPALWVPDRSCPSGKCPLWCSDAAYCTALCDPRCCGSRNMVNVSVNDQEKLDDCGWRNRFDSSKSSTYVKNGTHFTASAFLAKGDGFVGVDTVTLGGLGGLTIRPQTFGQATTLTFPSNYAFDGVLGIGSSSNYIDGLVPPLYNAQKQGVIDKNLLTIALIREGVRSSDLPGGTVTFGGIDTKNCGAVKAYLPALPGSVTPSEVSLKGLSFGGLHLQPDANALWDAICGLDTYAIFGPIDVVKALAQEVGAEVDSLGRFFIACNATVPSLFLTFGGEQYEIPPAELVRPFSPTDSRCIFNVYGDTESRWGETSVFSIGAALARKYCLIFDYDNQRLGLAPSRYSN